ncbi:Wiskott-Aldrich syndrome protein family member 3 [Bagarius yarrelli]|uniref:Wiskott-Aldrich syndrome protein family member 3 n=1 Tax=Bagarius yarrelli TaxID=175774 RepID=A0A556TYM5_BAGYA|nr:Wiskott-Aldrich syndrome protein family member 3 [Bagarius yarrelli]
MWKAFRSSSVEDQQVVSRSSVPNPVAEMYISCEKPPALSVLSTYRRIAVEYSDSEDEAELDANEWSD